MGSWGTGSWISGVGPEPSGATVSELLSVSCASSTNCWAVGDYIDAENVQKGLAMSWNGSGWSLQSVPNPSGAIASVLYGVDCASTSACTAVGSYVDTEEVQRPLAMTFNGSSWALSAVSLPPSAAGAVLTGVNAVLRLT